MSTEGYTGSYAVSAPNRARRYVRRIGGKRYRDPIGTIARRMSTMAKWYKYSKVKKIPWNINQQVHTFERIDPLSNLAQAAGGITAGAWSFTLAGVNGYAELTALYDFYRIAKVTIMITPLANVMDQQMLATPLYQRPFYWFYDYNDSTAPASLAEVWERAGVKRIQFPGKPFDIVLYPKILRMIYQSAVATSYEGVSSNEVWLNTADPSVPHYGVKYIFEDTQHALNTVLANVVAKVVIQCKNQK